MAQSCSNGIWDPERITALLARCGRYALERWREEDWRLKSDGSLVTDVDEALERELIAELECVADGIHVIGEETVACRDEAYISQAMAGRAYVVDPIDGTAPFAHGIGYWGTSIGLMEGGRLTHGGIVLPAQKELFVTDGDRVLWTDCLDLASGEPAELRVLEPCFTPCEAGRMVGLGQRFVRTAPFPWPNPTLVTGCAIQGLAYLMLGRLSAYVGYMKLWDLAAVLPMLLRCGVEVRLVDGTPVTASVVSEVFDLVAGSPTRWALQDECVFGPPSAFQSLYPVVCARLRGER
jgi:myo-inositol-1(or 4)-monophosphatase